MRAGDPMKEYDDGQPFEPYTDTGLPRCHAKSRSRNGGQCGNPAIPGGNVCRMHGGASPNALAAAQQRLQEMIPRALDRLATELDQGDNSMARLKAVKEVLDRAGLAGMMKVEHSTANEELKNLLLDLTMEDDEECDVDRPS